MAEGFSTFLESGPSDPSLFSTAKEYACRKAANFPDEGGPAMLRVDVPDEIIDLTVDEYFPRSQGLVQFDRGTGLEELQSAWGQLPKEIRLVEAP